MFGVGLSNSLEQLKKVGFQPENVMLKDCNLKYYLDIHVCLSIRLWSVQLFNSFKFRCCIKKGIHL